MDELIIKQDKYRLHLMPWMWFCFAYFAFFFFLRHDVTNAIFTAIATCISISVFFASLHWNAYQESKREVRFYKPTKTVAVVQVGFWGRVTKKSYRFSDFQGVRSYLISRGRSTANIVDLVLSNSDNGLMLAEFAPSSGKKFFTLSSGHLENEKASKLRHEIASFADLSDDGFVGHKWFGFHQID